MCVLTINRSAKLGQELLLDVVGVVSSAHGNAQEGKRSDLKDSINIAVSCDSIGALMRRTIKFHGD